MSLTVDNDQIIKKNIIVEIGLFFRFIICFAKYYEQFKWASNEFIKQAGAELRQAMLVSLHTYPNIQTIHFQKDEVVFH